MAVCLFFLQAYGMDSFAASLALVLSNAIEQGDGGQHDEQEKDGHAASRFEIIHGSVTAGLQDQGIHLMGRQNKAV